MLYADSWVNVFLVTLPGIIIKCRPTCFKKLCEHGIAICGLWIQLRYSSVLVACFQALASYGVVFSQPVKKFFKELLHAELGRKCVGSSIKCLVIGNGFLDCKTPVILRLSLQQLILKMYLLMFKSMTSNNLCWCLHLTKPRVFYIVIDLVSISFLG